MRSGQEHLIESITLHTRKLQGFRLLNVYSKEYGLLTLSGNKLGGRSEPFVHNALLIRNGKEDIHRIKQAEFLGHFNVAGQGFEVLTYAWLLAELLEVTSHGQDPESAAIFDLLLDALSRLSTGEDPTSISLRCIWQLASLLGYGPSLATCELRLSECSAHQKSSVSKPRFDFELGGIACNECAASIGGDSQSLLPGLVQGFCHLEQRNTHAVSRPAKEALLRILVQHLERQGKRKLHTFSMLKSLLEYREPLH